MLESCVPLSRRASCSVHVFLTECHALRDGEDEIKRSTSYLPGEDTVVTKVALKYEEAASDGLLR